MLQFLDWQWECGKRVRGVPSRSPLVQALRWHNLNSMSQTTSFYSSFYSNPMPVRTVHTLCIQLIMFMATAALSKQSVSLAMCLGLLGQNLHFNCIFQFLVPFAPHHICQYAHPSTSL